MVTGKCLPAVRQADECNEIGCRAQADDHGDHHGIEKLARAARPGRASFLGLESIAVADIDRAVGAPFPAAVINVKMMAMAVVVMTMPKMAMAKMTMTMTMAMPVVPVMAVPVAVTMTTVTMTSRESLTRDGQGSGGQRQSSDRGGNDLVDLRHARLLRLGRAGIALR